jgi:hypothetical protein
MSTKTIELPIASLTIAATLCFFSILIPATPSMAAAVDSPCGGPNGNNCHSPGQMKKVPGPLPIAGALAVVCWSRQLRKKCLSGNTVPE